MGGGRLLQGVTGGEKPHRRCCQGCCQETEGPAKARFGEGCIQSPEEGCQNECWEESYQGCVCREEGCCQEVCGGCQEICYECQERCSSWCQEEGCSKAQQGQVRESHEDEEVAT